MKGQAHGPAEPKPAYGGRRMIGGSYGDEV